MEKLQLVESKYNDGLYGWIDEIFEDMIRICFFDDGCDLISMQYFEENFVVTDEFL